MSAFDPEQTSLLANVTAMCDSALSHAMRQRRETAEQSLQYVEDKGGRDALPDDGAAKVATDMAPAVVTMLCYGSEKGII